MARSVFFVGTSPYGYEETFRLFSGAVDGLAARLPDGQQSGWLPNEALAKTGGLVPGNDEPIQPTAVTKTFRPAPGLAASDVVFDQLFYSRAAIDAYATFVGLRDAGDIPAGTRYQIALPTPFTSCLFFDWDVVGDLWPALERAMIDEIDSISAAIPHQDLAVSWDVVAEFMLMSADERRATYRFEDLIAAVARCIDSVAEPIEVGLHFCYGGHNSNGNIDSRSASEQQWLRPALRDLSDTEFMVTFFNAIKAATRRPIQWLHIPVPQHHDDDAYFAPLEELALGDETELYLGLVHLSDDAAASRRKLDAAARHVQNFGVAAACGLGTVVSGIPAEQIPAMLERHRAIAELE
jgi:hypothetical protein